MEFLGCLEILLLPFKLVRWMWRLAKASKPGADWIQAPDQVRENHGEPSGSPPIDLGWSELLDRRDVLIVRTETTGLGDRVEVIEVVAIDTTGNLRCRTLSLPEGPVSSQASRIHGLTRSVLERAGARPWPEIHDELNNVIRGASVVLGWNAMRELEWLKTTARRHNLRFDDERWQDLLEAYRELGHQGNDLDTVVRRHGVRVSGPLRRAETDCRRVLGVMRSVGGPGGVASR